ncbi:phosphatase 2C-like domain-containing protein [Xylariaceae sp. FL0804]|nr:phosphatase 2C-like domain-containing protein [Xylariaceae sp. FL0804]
MPVMLPRRILSCRPRLVTRTRVLSAAGSSGPIRFGFSFSSQTPPPEDAGRSDGTGRRILWGAGLAAAASTFAWTYLGSPGTASSDRKSALKKPAIALAGGSAAAAAPDLDALGAPSWEVAYAPAPTPQEVTRQLNEKAFYSAMSTAGAGAAADESDDDDDDDTVIRCYGAQLASNSPCEDAALHGTFAAPFGGGGGGGNHGRWMAWAVFDGHCGWQLSDLLTRQLMPFVRRALADIPIPIPNPPPTTKGGGDGGDGGPDEPDEEAVHGALRTAFTALDDALVKSAAATIDNSDLPFAEKARRLEPAYAGACALLTLYDPSTRRLRVASTGDCRAVLGIQQTTTTTTTTTPEAEGEGEGEGEGGSRSRWTADELTMDCTGATPSEVARIRAQFPDEPDVVRGGRVWGMQPSRTLGDGMWKWPAALKRDLRSRYDGPSLPSHTRYPGYREGPYLTAEPLVATREIPRDRPAFLIIATDGLWDTMSSAQAVDLVGRWVDWQQQKQQEKGNGNDKAEAAGPAPVDFGPTVLGWKQQCRYEERKATVRDDNAAVHLVRNGLGGADEEMVRGALTFRYPNSRDIRDDVTVQVVFFGGPKSSSSSKED